MLAYIFVVLAVAVRFMPHPWMFTPVVGSLLFFGARGPRRHIWIPFALLAASDVLLTKLVYNYPFTSDHYVTFAWYAAVLWLGTRLGAKTKFVPVIGAALASSVSFYLITNLAAWAWLDMYPKNLSGVMMSYVAALAILPERARRRSHFHACNVCHANGFARAFRRRQSK